MERTIVLLERGVQPLLKLVHKLLKVAARHVSQPDQLLPAARCRVGGAGQGRGGCWAERGGVGKLGCGVPAAQYSPLHFHPSTPPSHLNVFQMD